MPRVNILFKEGVLTDKNLKKIEKPLRKAVAEAISVGRFKMPSERVEFRPQVLHPMSVLLKQVTIEIETTLHEDRQNRFADTNPETDALVALRDKINNIPALSKKSLTVSVRFKPRDSRNVYSD